MTKRKYPEGMACVACGAVPVVAKAVCIKCYKALPKEPKQPKQPKPPKCSRPFNRLDAVERDRLANEQVDTYITQPHLARLAETLEAIRDAAHESDTARIAAMQQHAYNFLRQFRTEHSTKRGPDERRQPDADYVD